MTGNYLDDPNREAVGLEPAWAEGSGGSGTSAGGGPPGDPLDDMTKAELIDHAEAQGVDVNEQMTKAEIKDAIQAG